MELYHAFCQSAERFSGKTAFEWEGGFLSYGDLLHQSNIVGQYLKEHLSTPRQNVGLLCPNTINFPFGLFGLLGAGHVAVPLNPLLKPEEAATLLSHAETPVLLYDPLLKELAEATAKLANVPIQPMAIPEILQNGNLNPSNLDPEVNPEDLSMILYTSGTTGDPKGVMLSHLNIYSNYDGFTKVLQFNEDDTFPCILPLFHTFAMTVILFGALLKGSRVILFPQFVPQKVIEVIMKEPNVILVAVPPMIYMITHFTPKENAKNHKIRHLVSGGGPLPQDVAKAFVKKFDHELLEGYGLTETSPVVATNRPGQNRMGTIGTPLPGIEVDVRDENGKTLGNGVIGELCVRGDNVMMGYYKNSVMTQEAFFEDGWFRTGDMAVKDEDGYLQIVGRLKDVIVCGGENIYPREIEEILLRHPGVLEAAVVGEPNKLRTEIPHAFLVLQDEVKDKVTVSELRKYCREHLAEYKVPEEFTFIDEMPKTATRKIQKEEIKKKYFSSGLE